MMKLLLPIVLLVLGTGAGVGAAIAMKPPPEEASDSEAVACLPTEQLKGTEEEMPAAAPMEDIPVEFVELENQFVIPVISNEEIASMVVVSLSLEVPLGGRDPIVEIEPKLRDVFLRAMFDHANIGGFSGNFTSSSNMRILRGDLLRQAKNLLGDAVRDVLIIEIVRQDI